MHTKWAALIAVVCAVSVAIGAGACGARRASEGDALQAPANLDDALTQLSRSFEAAKWRGTSSVETSLHRNFQLTIDANRGPIETLLAPAATSPAYASDLAGRLLSPLHAYAERFRPGSTIDDSVLGRTTFAMGETYDYGLELRAYLLLQLVKQQRSAALAREVFAAFDETIRADSYLCVQRTLYWHREETEFDVAAALAREREEFGGENPGPVGSQLAALCEAFLTHLYLSDEPAYLPSPAMDRVEAYWQWRKETMVTDNSPDWLRHRHMYATVNCIRDLVTLLQ
jgi:hypothetical protein